MDVLEFKQLVDDYILSEQVVCAFDEVHERQAFGITYTPVDSPFGNFHQTMRERHRMHDKIHTIVMHADNLYELVQVLTPLKDATDHWEFYCQIMIACKENPDEQAQAMLNLSGFYERYLEALRMDECWDYT